MVDHNSIDACYEAGNVTTHWEESHGFDKLHVPHSCDDCGRTWEEQYKREDTKET
jgi:hypothetical protein